MDEMSKRIKSAMPIALAWLKRHPVSQQEIEPVLNILRYSLWQCIQKQETTHQTFPLTRLFEFQAKSDLKAVHVKKSLIAIPARKLYKKEWQAKHMPKVFSTDDKPEDFEKMDTLQSKEMDPLDVVIKQEELDSLNDDELLFINLQIEGVRGEKLMADTMKISHQNFRYMKQGLKKRFLK